MSVTVRYKDSIITTLNGETKTLTTSGKWMEDNITLIDDTIDGDLLEYGDVTAPTVGIGLVGQAILQT